MKFYFDNGCDPVARTLLEGALGHILLEAVANADVSLEKLAATVAVKLLNEIIDILDDVSLNDEQCVEQIVVALYEYGLRTVRHDD